MAKYTITIKTLIDNDFDFGLQDYPIFNESYREILNNNILNYYYENEIGFETPALFKRYLNNQMALIMGKYNPIYKAQEQLLENLLDNVNLKERYTRNTNNLTNSTSNSTSKNKNLFQDTPQGQLDFTELENQNWATNYSMANSNIDDTSESTGEGQEIFERTITGNNGNKYSIEVFKELKNNFVNVDMLIIEDLQDLFMGLF